MTKEKFTNWIEVEDYLNSIFDNHRDIAIFSGLDEFQAQRLAEKSVNDCLLRLESKNIPTQEQCIVVSEEVAKIWF